MYIHMWNTCALVKLRKVWASGIIKIHAQDYKSCDYKLLLTKSKAFVIHGSHIGSLGVDLVDACDTPLTRHTAIHVYW